MDDEIPEHDFFGAKSVIVLGGVLSSVWMSVLLFYPMVWAIGTGIVLMMLFGMFTARFILGTQSLWMALALAPFLGSAWLGFFYVMFRLLKI